MKKKGNFLRIDKRTSCLLALEEQRDLSDTRSHPHCQRWWWSWKMDVSQRDCSCEKSSSISSNWLVRSFLPYTWPLNSVQHSIWPICFYCHLITRSKSTTCDVPFWKTLQDDNDRNRSKSTTRGANQRVWLPRGCTPVQLVRLVGRRTEWLMLVC